MATEETIEQKVERLEKENKKLTDTNKDLTNQVTTAQAASTVLQTKFDDLKKDHDQLTKDHGALQTESSEVIAELGAKLNAAQKVVDRVEPTITIGNTEYNIIGKKFRYRRDGQVEAKDYTVQDLLEDVPLQKELVKKQVGFLVKKPA